MSPEQPEDVRLDSFHLSTRTANLLERHQLMWLSEVAQLSRDELLTIAGAGEKFADEILACVELACPGAVTLDEPQTVSNETPTFRERLPDLALDPPEFASTAFADEIVARVITLNVSSWDELLDLSELHLSVWPKVGPGKIERIVEELSALNDSIRNASQNRAGSTSRVQSLLEAIALASLVEGSALVDDLVGPTTKVGSEELVEDLLLAAPGDFIGTAAAVENELASLDERARYVAIERLGNARSGRPTLEELGAELGVSRERVRQIESKTRVGIECCFDDQLVAGFRRAFGVAGPADELEKLSATFCGVAENPAANNVARSLLVQAAGYTIEGDVALSDRAGKVETLVRAFLNDVDHLSKGLVAHELLVAELDGFRAAEWIDWFMVERMGLVRLEELWLQRDSRRIRVLAAMWLIGGPATKQQIAERAGLRPDESLRVASYLSDFEEVCRATKSQWALRRHVDDPYDGIASEIAAQIERDGGWSQVDQLAADMPGRFDVSPVSVRMNLDTPQFVIEGGRVRCATAEEMDAYRPPLPHSEPNAVLLDDGRWAQEVVVEERYFHGYSAYVSEAVAWANGIRPRDDLEVRLRGHDEPVSVIWRLRGTSRHVDIGRIRRFLAAEGFVSGDHMLIVPSRECVEIRKVAA